ncbi:MAG: hypothetical protein KC620_09290, partial [Myxococcales bacterium]|nr:hypothetical protein [Myxococcales bacterium]
MAALARPLRLTAIIACAFAFVACGDDEGTDPLPDMGMEVDATEMVDGDAALPPDQGTRCVRDDACP